jgi:hypothetical protein
MMTEGAGPVLPSTAARVWDLLVERAEEAAREQERTALTLERLAAVRTDDQSWQHAITGWRTALSARDFAVRVASLAARLGTAR